MGTENVARRASGDVLNFKQNVQSSSRSRDLAAKPQALVVISYGRTPTMRTMDWKWHGCVSGTGLGMLLRPSATALVR